MRTDWPVRSGHPLGVGDGPGLGDDAHADLIVDQEPESLADHGVVIRQHHGQLIAGGVGRKGLGHKITLCEVAGRSVRVTP